MYLDWAIGILSLVVIAGGLLGGTSIGAKAKIDRRWGGQLLGTTTSLIGFILLLILYHIKS